MKTQKRNITVSSAHAAALRLAVQSLAFSFALCCQALSIGVNVSINGSEFDYTVLNQEPLGSANYVSAFSLQVNAPIVSIAAPVGWDFITDNSSFVTWFNTDVSLPYVHDVAPGSSLSGFDLQSSVTTSDILSFVVTSWDHSLDQLGPASDGTILAPSAQSVPEGGSTGLLLGAALAVISVWVRRGAYS
jgi:hypothetical protein